MIAAGHRRARSRSSWRRHATGRLLAALGGLLLTAPGWPVADRERPASADELLVVDCLLPGQIRQLGQRSTYVSPRRPVRTSARDCQIRGGEYVAYDRANLQTALTVWLPAARAGDVEAMIVVGEMFEKGLGVPADHTAAAQWYRQAADRGAARARINLGHLYEQGLGVPRDPAEALRWYRLAAGLAGTIELDHGAPDRAAASAALQRELEQLRREAAELRVALERAQQQLEAAPRIAEPPPEAPPPAAPPPAAPPPAEAAAAAQQAAELGQLRGDLTAAQEQVRALAAQLAEARADLDTAGAGLARAEDEQQALRSAAAAASGTAAAELARQAEAGELRLRALAESLQQREVALARQQQDTAQLVAELERVREDAAARQQRIAELELQLTPPAGAAPAAPMAGPELALVEPQLLATRGVMVVAAGAGSDAAERRIIGRVTAPAGLLHLAVNDQAVEPNDLGVFSAQVAVRGAATPVAIVAVDRQGRRAALEFLLAGREPAAGAATPAATAAAPPWAGIEFGRYHALVIGNNEYRHLPDLKSAVSDARDLASVLEQRYGFTVTLLLDADRYRILAELNALRERLTAADNLLIYYAGHGELDEVNSRGHWLPVDAEPASTANWIPTTAITDILNILSARQVLLVVDSCYAGALTRSSVARLGTGATESERLHWLRTVSQKRSRTVLTSGGLEPVLDAGGGGHSVFARALLEVLNANDDVLDGQRLHREVAARVSFAAGNVGFDQVPEYAPIRFAGHEAGEFFFVPRL